MHYAGLAKLVLRRRRSGFVATPVPRIHQNDSVAHFHLAAALALLGSLEEARAAVRTGLALDPTFAIRRMRGRVSEDLTFRAGSKRVHDGMRMAGVPEE
jgi:hypothetical protein